MHSTDSIRETTQDTGNMSAASYSSGSTSVLAIPPIYQIRSITDLNLQAIYWLEKHLLYIL